MVHDPCNLDSDIDPFKGVFDRKDAEGDCLIIQGIEDSEILVQVDLLCSDLLLLKLLNCLPIDDHLLTPSSRLIPHTPGGLGVSNNS